MDVLFIWRGPSPYRVDFFNELGKYCKLKVLFELRPNKIKDRNPDWFHEQYNNFEALYLNNIYVHGRNFSYNLLYQVLKWKRNHKNGIIVVGMYSTPSQAVLILVMKLLKIKYILSSDGGFVKKDGFFGYRIKTGLIKGAYCYLSTGSLTSKYLEHYGANPQKICVYPFTTYRVDELPNAIVDKRQLKKALQLDLSSKYVISVGQFIYRKGFDILLKAAEFTDDNVKFLIAGGNPTDEYRQLCKHLPDGKVEFLGFLDKETLAKYYGASDLFAFPTREDIWGLVINEAMAFGMPVITTDKCIAGVELVENGINGYIIPTDDVTALADAMNNILINDKLRQSMSFANINKMKSYTIEEMAKCHYEIFKKLACEE